MDVDLPLNRKRSSCSFLLHSCKECCVYYLLNVLRAFFGSDFPSHHFCRLRIIFLAHSLWFSTMPCAAVVRQQRSLHITYPQLLLTRCLRSPSLPFFFAFNTSSITSIDIFKFAKLKGHGKLIVLKGILFCNKIWLKSASASGALSCPQKTNTSAYIKVTELINVFALQRILHVMTFSRNVQQTFSILLIDASSCCRHTRTIAPVNGEFGS